MAIKVSIVDSGLNIYRTEEGSTLGGGPRAGDAPWGPTRTVQACRAKVHFFSTRPTTGKTPPGEDLSMGSHAGGGGVFSVVGGQSRA